MSLKLLTFISLSILGIITIFYFFLPSNGEPKSINVLEYTALGDGKKDDTEAIQHAIDKLADQGGGTVLFPKGEYLINPKKSINLKNNIILKFSKGATLIALPVSSSSYSIIKIQDVEDVSILGEVTIIGERYEHTGTRGEWGFGISIRGANNVYIENARIKDCWGDGIYIGSSEKQNYNKNIKIVNPIIDNNRRQGISVISAINLEIINPVITNTNGTPPQSGIDFEPNDPLEHLQNIRVINPVIENNKQYGLQFFFKDLKYSKNRVTIEIINSKKIKDQIKITKTEGVKGKITIDNKIVFNN